MSEDKIKMSKDNTLESAYVITDILPLKDNGEESITNIDEDNLAIDENEQELEQILQSISESQARIDKHFVEIELLDQQLDDALQSLKY